MATKGPWFAGELREFPDTGQQFVTVGPFDAPEHYEDTICEVWGDNHDAQANARLIAAAPQLVEALETYFALLDSDPKIRGAMPEIVDRVFGNAARAALTAAKGEP